MLRPGLLRPSSMPHDVTEPSDQETGFGTGLRRQLERRRTRPGEEPEAAADHADRAEALAVDQPEGERSEVEQLPAEPESALAREAGPRPSSRPRRTSSPVCGLGGHSTSRRSYFGETA